MKTIAVITYIVCLAGLRVNGEYFQPEQGDLYAEASERWGGGAINKFNSGGSSKYGGGFGGFSGSKSNVPLYGGGSSFGKGISHGGSGFGSASIYGAKGQNYGNKGYGSSFGGVSGFGKGQGFGSGSLNYGGAGKGVYGSSGFGYGAKGQSNGCPCGSNYGGSGFGNRGNAHGTGYYSGTKGYRSFNNEVVGSSNSEDHDSDDTVASSPHSGDQGTPHSAYHSSPQSGDHGSPHSVDHFDDNGSQHSRHHGLPHSADHGSHDDHDDTKMTVGSPYPGDYDHYGPAISPPHTFSYPSPQPPVKCGNNLLISCSPTSQVVPCTSSYAAPAHGPSSY